MGLSYDSNCLNISGVIRELEHEETFKSPVPRTLTWGTFEALQGPNRGQDHHYVAGLDGLGVGISWDIRNIWWAPEKSLF